MIERHDVVLPSLGDEHLTRLLDRPPRGAARAATLLLVPAQYRQGVEAFVSEATASLRFVTHGGERWAYFESTDISTEDAYRAALLQLVRQGVDLLETGGQVARILSAQWHPGDVQSE